LCLFVIIAAMRIGGDHIRAEDASVATNAAASPGYLGVIVRRATNGVEVLDLVAGYGAEAAGIRNGDIILEVADTKIASVLDLVMAARKLAPGSKGAVRFQRGMQEHTVQVTMGSPPAGSGVVVPTAQAPDLGSVSSLSSFEPDRVTFAMKEAKTRAILDELLKQSGNMIKRESSAHDIVHAEFCAENETFWEVLDRLSRKSGNVYGQRAFQGGG
jgi:hypothetical protein